MDVEVRRLWISKKASSSWSRVLDDEGLGKKEKAKTWSNEAGSCTVHKQTMKNESHVTNYIN